MKRWVRIAPAPVIPEGGGRTVVADGMRIALFRLGGKLFALDDTCPHRGASLGEGLLAGAAVVCPWHSWSFDLHTGENPRAPEVAVRTYPVRQEEGGIEVEIPGAENDAPPCEGPA